MNKNGMQYEKQNTKTQTMIILALLTVLNETALSGLMML